MTAALTNVSKAVWEVLVTKELRVFTLWSFAAEHTDPLNTARADTMNC